MLLQFFLRLKKLAFASALTFMCFIGKTQCPTVKATSLTVVTFKFGTHFGGTINLLDISTTNGSSSFSGSELISANDSTVTVDLSNPTSGVNTNDSNDIATFNHASDGFLDQDCYVGILLPIKLLSLNAVKENGSIVLKWKTLQEVGVSHFEIEASKNGKNWVSVSRINVESNSKKIVEYTYSSKNKGGTFYRLKIVNNDETYDYSKVIMSDHNTSNIIHLFPNPALNEVNIQGKFSLVTIYNLVGQIVLTSDKNKINLTSLSNGIYYISTTNLYGLTSTPQKLVIAKE